VIHTGDREVQQASKVLGELIDRRGPLSADGAWNVFLDFARLPFAAPDTPDADGLLYQFGIFDFSGEPRFHLDLVRQFSATGADEYIQCHCDVQFNPDEALSSLGRYAQWWWPQEGVSLGRWSETIAKRAEWPVLRERRPVSIEIYQDET
jgi:hypothetical protein